MVVAVKERCECEWDLEGVSSKLSSSTDTQRLIFEISRSHLPAATTNNTHLLPRPRHSSTLPHGHGHGQ